VGKFAGFNVRLSYLVLPVLGFFCFIRMLSRNGLIFDNLLSILFCLYTSIMFVSLLLNIDFLTTSSYANSFLWLMGFLFFVLYSPTLRRSSPEKLSSLGENMLLILVPIGVIALVVGVMEVIKPLEVHALYSPDRGEELMGHAMSMDLLIELKRVGSIVGAPNAFGAFMSMCTITACSVALMKKKHWYFLLAALLFLGNGLLSGSRGALVGSFLTILAMLIYFRRFFLLGSILAASLGAVAFIPALQQIFRSKYAESYYSNAPLEFGAFNERLFFWAETLWSLVQNPIHMIYGYGPANKLLIDKINVGSAHNIFLSSIHDYGIVGFAILMSLIIYLFYINISIIKQFKGNDFFSTTSIFIMIALLVHSLADNVFLSNTFIMWSCFPWLAVLSNIYLSVRKSKMHLASATWKMESAHRLTRV
jgi:oligosaccharide repeat unit polymerase